MKQDTTYQWFCLRAKPKREHLAGKILATRFAFEVFHPRISVVRNTRRGPKTFTEALFPGYCFARFDQETDQRKVLGSQDIKGMVRFGEHTPTIPEETIESLRQQFPQNQQLELDPPGIKEGDIVEIIAGSLFGQSGVVHGVNHDTDRASLLIDFLGRQIPIQVPRRQIIKPNASRESYPKLLLATPSR